MAVDNFGNLITNIDFRKLEKMRQAGQELIQIKIGSHVISGLSETYNSVQSKTSLALIGSRGYLEIAVNKGNAAQVLNVEKGTEVRVMV